MFMYMYTGPRLNSPLNVLVILDSIALSCFLPKYLEAPPLLKYWERFS